MPFLGSGFPLIPGLVLRLMLGFPAQALIHAPPREIKFTAEFGAGPV